MTEEMTKIRAYQWLDFKLWFMLSKIYKNWIIILLNEG